MAGVNENADVEKQLEDLRKLWDDGFAEGVIHAETATTFPEFFNKKFRDMRIGERGFLIGYEYMRRQRMDA